MKKFHRNHLFFSLLIMGFVQVPSMSWAQDTVTQPEVEEGAGETFQELQKNNPEQLKKRPKALKQRRENRQDRRQDFRSKRQGGDQRKGGNRGGGGRGRR